MNSKCSKSLWVIVNIAATLVFIVALMFGLGWAIVFGICWAMLWPIFQSTR